jgi:hypothetical protein
MRRNVNWCILAFVLRAAVLVCFGFLLPTSAFGYCQQPHANVACEFLNSDAVFVGTVISVRDEPPMRSGDGSPDGWIYALTVQRLFRGPSSERIEVYTENANARFPMEIGKQYLLFAANFHRRLEITSCGNSALLAEARNAVATLEGLAIPDDAVIEGNISPPTKDRGSRSKGIVVVIRGEGRTFEAVSDSSGWFHLHVPPGKYSATIRETTRQRYFASIDSVDNPQHFVATKGHCSGLQFSPE